MANEVDDIVQNVVLTGNEEVAAGFDKIQEAGEKAFDSLKKAAENAFSFTGLLEAVGGLAAAFSIAGVGVFEFVRRTEESVSQLSDLADQIGSTTEEMSGLRAAFAAGGVSADTMQNSFRRLSLITEQTWSEIKKQARDGADQLKQDALSVSGATIAAAEAQQKVQNLQRDTAQSEKSDLNSVQEARLRLAELNGQDVSAQRERLQVSQARLALDQATAKQADDLANAEGNRQKAFDAAEKTGLDLEAARKKHTDDQKNDIKNVIDAVKSLAAGNGDALKGINASTENLVKGIVGAAAEGDKALGKMRGDITDLSSPAPEVKSVFDTLASTLANLQDPAQKTALAMRLLRREVSQAEINVLSSSQKLGEFRQRIEDLKLGIDETDKAVSEKFRQTLFGLQNDISLVAAKLATAFGPSATTVLQALDDALISNRDALISFASTLGGQVQDVVGSFIRVLSGVPDAAKDQWLVDYISKLKAFAGVVGDVVGIVGSIAGALVGLATSVADTLNSAFGTNINAVDVLFTAWFVKTAAGFITLRAAAETAATGIAVSFATVAARFGLVGFAALTLYEIIKGFHDLTIGDNLASSLQGLGDRLHAIRGFLAGDFAQGIEDFKKANADQISREADDAKKRKELSDEKKTQDADVAKNLSDTNKAALDKADADTHSSVEHRIAETQRLAAQAKTLSESTKKSEEEAKASSADANKVAQTTRNSDGSFTDQNGIKIFGQNPTSSPGGGVSQTNLSSQLEAALQQARKSGPAIIDGFGIGGGGVSGFPGSFPVIRQPIASTDNQGRDTKRSSQDIDDLATGVKKGFEDFHREQQDVNPIDAATGRDTSRASQDLPTELDPAKVFNDKIQNFLDKALNDPGSLTSPNRPERQPVTPVDPNTLPDVGQSALSTAIESLSSKFGELISSLSAALTKPDNTSTSTDQLGIRGDAQQADETAIAGLDAVGASASSASGPLDDIGPAASSAASALSSISSDGSSNVASTSNDNVSNDSSVVAAATGGYIRGPGGPTGDKIPALLSDKEYVHTAAATEFWGVEFMHAINRLQMPRFAQGGLVGLFSPQIPRFASGGLVSRDPMQHLGTVDLTTNHGTVRVAVAQSGLAQLRRAAVRQNLGSEQKPSWVR